MLVTAAMVGTEKMDKTVKMDVVALVAQRGRLDLLPRVVATKDPVAIKVLVVLVEKKDLVVNKDHAEYVENRGFADLVVSMDPVVVLDPKVRKGSRESRAPMAPHFHRLFYM